MKKFPEFFTFEQVVRSIESECDVDFHNDPQDFYIYIYSVFETLQQYTWELEELYSENEALRNKIIELEAKNK